MVDYIFYTSTYGGNTVPELSFPVYLRRARLVLDKYTFGTIVEQNGVYGQMVRGEFQEFTNAELLALQYAICSLMDTLVNLDNAEKKALAGSADGANIKSRSSGGESISYEAVKTAYDVAVGDETKKAGLYRNAIMAYVIPTAFRINPFYAGMG